MDDHSVTEPTVIGESGTAITEPAPAATAVSDPATAVTREMPSVAQLTPRVAERCAQCAAPLAHDQRYCLQCGAPGAHAGGPLSGAHPGEPSPLSSPDGLGGPQAQPSPPGFAQGVYGTGPAATPAAHNNSLALLAGVGVLLLAMGVGVLIGRAGAGSAKAPPAQVISIGGSAAGAATTPMTPTPQTPAVPSTKKQTKAKEPAGTGSSITKPAPPSAVQNLRSGGSGQSYEQRSKALPNVVSTG